MTEVAESKNYLQTLEFIKKQVKTAQIKAHLSVNKEMLILYWKVGKTTIEKQEQEVWGVKIIKKLSANLIKAFTNMKGFSYTNIRYMQRFTEHYPDLLICQAPLGKLDKDSNNAVISPQTGGKLENRIFYSDYANVILGITLMGVNRLNVVRFVEKWKLT